MVRYYKKPVLLIEFDESILFKLYETNDSALGGELNSQSIISKITLLTLHFPTLQIIWSKGPSHTAEIFKDIRKQAVLGGYSTKDPDLQKIAKIGTITDEDDVNQQDDDFKKYLAFEFVKRLPGIDSNNVNKVTRNVITVTEICRMPEEDLKKFIGVKNAKDLKSFIEKKVEIITKKQ